MYVHRFLTITSTDEYTLMQDPKSPTTPLAKRIRAMLTKIDKQLSEYDAKVGSSLQMISCDPQGRISVQDLEKALAVIKHKPDEEVGHAVIQKLDVDKDGYVELEHVLGLVREEGLGTIHQKTSREAPSNQGCILQDKLSTRKHKTSLVKARN